MKKKFFLKRVAVYLGMMLIPMLLLFAAFSFMNLRSIDKDLKRQGKQTVNAVNVNFDLVLSNVLYQNDLLTSTTRMNLSLKRILNRDELSYGDATNISSLRAILSSIKDSHEYIESIYIYLNEAERFFSSDKGIHVINSNEDTEWINTYKELGKENNSYIAVREISRGPAQALEVLSVYKRLLFQKGCIVVNIDVARLKEILSKQISNHKETLYLVNHEGTVLCQKTNGDSQGLSEVYFTEFKSDYGESWQEQLLSMDGTWIKTPDGVFLMSIGRYEGMEIYYVSAISSEARTESILALMSSFLIFLVLDLCIVILLAYITTKRSFDQIYYMIGVFNEAEKGLPVKKPENRSRDEYDVIMNNIIYLFLNTNYLNTQLKENEYKKDYAEMMALQLQINPHFLFNTLQTVDMEVRDHNSKREDISMIIRAVSDILKYALSNPNESVTIQEEIKYLQKYIMIQKYRFGDQFIIYYEVEREILSAKVFRLFLQPLVENSLLHGIRGMEKGYIKVSIYRRGDRLRCCVLDTGVGMSQEELENLRKHITDEHTRGIGLVNLYRRLVLRYGEGSSLRILSKKGLGTAISFYIPLEE